MNTKRAYPIGVAIVVGAIAYTVWTSSQPMTCSDLVAEGTASADCHQTLVTCPSYVSDWLAGALTTKGLPLPREGQRYALATTAQYVWSGDDAGTAPGSFIQVLDALGVRDNTGKVLQVLDVTRCRFSPCDDLCASPLPIRWEDAGLPCVRAELDGGQTCMRWDPVQSRATWPGAGTVFPADEARGGDCEPVAAGCGTLGVVGATEGAL